MTDPKRPSAALQEWAAQEDQRMAKGVREALMHDVQFGSGYHTFDILTLWGFRPSIYLDEDRVWRASIRGRNAMGQDIEVEEASTGQAMEALRKAVQRFLEAYTFTSQICGSADGRALDPGAA